MPKKVVVEFKAKGEWRQVGVALVPGMPNGSLSTQPPTGVRQIFHFGWHEDVPGVWVSTGGADFEVGPMRATIPLMGLERIADLREGPCELTIHNRKVGEIEARFRLLE